MKSTFTLALAIVSLLASAASAQEWTRFRGPNGSGVNAAAAHLPVKFTPADYRWNVELGAGTSSPVLWGGKLFVTAEGAEEGNRAVLCFDALTGTQTWSHTDAFKPHGHHKFNNFASATPAVDAQHVYVSWTSGEEMHVLALTHAGAIAWEVNLGFFKEEHGSGASPVVVGQVLVVAKDHNQDGAFLTGLNVADGKTLWKLPRKTARSAFSTPLVVEEVKGQPAVIFTSNPNALTAVDPKTGKILWNQDYTETTEFRAVGSAAYADGVYFTNVGQGTSGRSGAAVKVNNGKPVTAWELPKAMPYVPTPLALGGYFYVLNDGGILTCLKASTGKVIYSERVAENAYSSPVCGGQQIYCISRTGKVVAVQAGEKFQILGESQLGEPCESTPAIAGGMLFIRTAKHLIALGGPKPAASNEYQGRGVKVSLLAEAQSVQPGQPFTVGFRLEHGAGWHTYWKNPGLAGVPFEVQWALPDGWHAEPMQYAPPDKVMMASIHTHGYERDVLHLVQITPAADARAGEMTLRAKAHWLCCSTTCQLGNCELALAVPVRAAPPMADPSVAAAFTAARAAFPAATPHWQCLAQRVGKEIVLTCTGADLPAVADAPMFFSDNKLICSDPTQQWARQQDILTAHLPLADYAPVGLTQLSGLLYSAGHYTTLDVPVTQ